MGAAEIMDLPLVEIDKAYAVQEELRQTDPNFSLEPLDKNTAAQGGCMEGMCFV